jgi:hypothetical protein
LRERHDFRDCPEEVGDLPTADTRPGCSPDYSGERQCPKDWRDIELKAGRAIQHRLKYKFPSALWGGLHGVEEIPKNGITKWPERVEWFPN